jgi:hypothetical protein
MKSLAEATVLAAALLIISGCSHIPKPPPECRGTATPINTPEAPAAARP